MHTAAFSSHTAKRIGEVDAALRSSAVDPDVWMATADALASLYRWESYSQRNVPDYWGLRAADEGGRVLGGLIWFRGFVEHRAIGNGERAWVQATTLYLAADGTLKPTKPVGLVNGQFKELFVKVATQVWPAPAAGEPADKHGRDKWYRDLVQGHGVVQTLNTASAFLDGLT